MRLRAWPRATRVAALLLLLLPLGALLAGGGRRAARTRADFPRRSPAALAHFLADFAQRARLHRGVGAWTVEEESHDHACWRYAVAYECGARCAGRALVAACALDAAPAHAPAHASAHAPRRVQVADRRCWRLPALPWPQLCESVDTDSVVTALEGGGARLDEQASVQCGVLAALAGRCDAAAARREHTRALREALA